MAPKRKRSRSKSRSPQRKRSKSKVKASQASSKEEKKSKEEKTYGRDKKMSQVLRANLGRYTGGPDQHSMDPGIFDIIEKIGDFHPCDGPTESGKLCYKDPNYFLDKYKIDCSSYCREPIRCFERLLYLYNSFPKEIKVTEIKVIGNDEVQIIADRTDMITMQVYGGFLNTFYLLEKLPQKKNEWRQIHRDRKSSSEETLNISDEEAISLICDYSFKLRQGDLPLRIEIRCIYRPRSILVEGIYDVKLVSPNLDIRYQIHRVHMREWGGSLNYVLSISMEI